MTPIELEHYLHEQLPLTRALRLFVVEVQPDTITVGAPLQPNINHKRTVFGGSAATLATTAAWSLVHTRLAAENVAGQVVIQRSAMEFLLPMADEFRARAFVPQLEDWQRFIQMCKRRGRGRVTITAELTCAGKVTGKFTGDFVVVPDE
jgi:thioesterase domain-containing protein